MPGQRSQLKRFALWLQLALSAAVSLLALGCGHNGSPATNEGKAAAVTARSDLPLGPRALAVASADALAVDAEHLPRPEAERALEAAAGLRTRLFRRERREADALEALELRARLARGQGAARCESELEGALLLGELRVDPEGTYRTLSALSRTAAGPCATRAEAALAMLQAFRPLDEGKPSPASSGSASPSGDPQASPGSSPDLAEGSTLLRIERYSSKDAARVVAFLSKPVRFEVGSVKDGVGPRLFVDLHGAKYRGKSPLGAEGLLQQVRAVQGGEGTRVVLDLEGPAEHRVFYVADPFRLIIDVAKPRNLASREVRRVVLDPGHGGHDPGATGPTGLREKDVALDIAHRAAPLIARELGISTLLTRDADVYVPLEERTARANGFGADLFISIHCNATERSGSSGVMTFVLDDTKDQLAARIAALENSASAEATSELGRVMGQSADHVNAARSNELANLLQRAAMASLAPSYPDVPDGGVKRAGFYVLAGARMPAVLFETSFISSARDETRFNTGNFRQKLADAIVNAIRAYKEGRRSGP